MVGFGPGIRKRLQLAGLKDWRFDFAWPNHLLAMEVDGGGWTQGRHTRGAGHDGDIVKQTQAAIHGWEVMRCNGNTINSGLALQAIEARLKIDARLISE